MMAKIGENLLDAAFYSRAIAKWARIARMARSADLIGLRRQRLRARQLKAHLDQLIHIADERLALPLGVATRIMARPIAESRSVFGAEPCNAGQ